ncbi:MAG TPA: hypothetical protein VIZ86_02440 [Pseudomonas sp.]
MNHGDCRIWIVSAVIGLRHAIQFLLVTRQGFPALTGNNHAGYSVVALPKLTGFHGWPVFLVLIRESALHGFPFIALAVISSFSGL